MKTFDFPRVVPAGAPLCCLKCQLVLGTLKEPVHVTEVVHESMIEWVQPDFKMALCSGEFSCRRCVGDIAFLVQHKLQG